VVRAFLTGFTEEFSSVAEYERIERGVISAACCWPSE
jgi:hypothetical protein